MRYLILILALIGCNADNQHAINTSAVYIDNYACVINAVDEDGNVRPMAEFEADMVACAMYHNICLNGENDGKTCR